MLRPENALKNAEYVGYSTPNLPAKEMLPEEKREDKSFYPDAETMKHLEVYEKFDHKWTGKYSDLFLQFKCTGSRRYAFLSAFLVDAEPKKNDIIRKLVIFCRLAEKWRC